MREEAQRASSRDRRVFLAQRAGGSVARVGEDLAARRFLPRIQGLKVRFRHVHFAADLKHVWRALDVLRDVEDRARIRRHIFADRAVAARRGEHEFAAFVAQGAGQAVDLRLRRDRDRLVRRKREEAAHARDKLDHFRVRKRIVDAEHRPRMGHFGERRRRCCAEPLRRGVGADQLREARLEFAVLAHQRVIFRVGNLRRVLVVIEPVMTRDLLRQPHQPVGRLGVGQRVTHAR